MGCNLKKGTYDLCADATFSRGFFVSLGFLLLKSDSDCSLHINPQQHLLHRGLHRQNHTVTGLEGTSRDHRVKLLAKADIP